MSYELHSIATADNQTYLLNRDFMQGKGRLVLNPSPANWGMPPITYNRTEMYKGDGEMEIDYRLGVRNFELMIQDTACNRSDWLTIRQKLLDVCRPNRGGLLTYTFELSSGEQRSIEGRALIPFEAVDEDTFDDWSFVDRVAFECPNPVWSATTESSCTATRRTATQLVFPITFPITFGDADRYGDCILNYGTTGGTWGTYPVIEATGPFNRLTINHEEKDISLYFTKQLFAGQTVTFDLRRRYANATEAAIFNVPIFSLIGPTVSDAAGNDYFSYLDKLSNLADFKIEPASLITPGGVNTISFDAPGLVDGQTGFVVRYYVRYIGI